MEWQVAIFEYGEVACRPQALFAICIQISDTRHCCGALGRHVLRRADQHAAEGLADIAVTVTSASAGRERRATPKSRSLTSSVAPIITLSGFRSRWTMPAR